MPEKVTYQEALKELKAKKLAYYIALWEIYNGEIVVCQDAATSLRMCISGFYKLIAHLIKLGYAMRINDPKKIILTKRVTVTNADV